MPFFVFSYVFTIMAFLGILFALQVKDDLQHVSGIIYAGSTLGVVLAGDFLSLYIFWEIMAVSSRQGIITCAAVQAISQAVAGDAVG